MFRKFLVGLLAVTVIVSGYTFYNRYVLEKSMDKVEIVAEWKATGYYGFQDIANDNNIQFTSLAKKIRNSGINSIAVHEQSLYNFEEEGKVKVYYLQDIVNEYYSLGTGSSIIETVVKKYENLVPTNYWDNYMVVITRDIEIANFVSNSLMKRCKNNTLDLIESDGVYAVVSSKRIDLKEGLGFLDSELNIVTSLGFDNVIARMQNYENIDEQGIIEKIDQLKKYNIDTVVFGGSSVLGYKYNLKDGDEQKLLKFAAEKFKENGIIVGVIEVPAEQSIEKLQAGITLFSTICGYNETKVFSPETKNDVDTVYEQVSRAVVDRRCRIVYLRPIYQTNSDSAKNLDDTYELISKVKSRVESLDFKLDKSNAMGSFGPTDKERAVIFLGIITGGVLLLDLVFNFKFYYEGLILILGSIGTLMIFFSTVLHSMFAGISMKVMALMSAIIFASLAGYFLIYEYKKIANKKDNMGLVYIILRSLGILISTIFIAFIGGLFISTLLGDSKYMLKLDVFSGVKVAFILPVLIFLFMYMKEVGIYKSDNNISLKTQIKKLLNTSITVKYGILVFLFLGAFAFLLLRTGNSTTSMLLPFEDNIRTFLEQNLSARPRTKDLLSFPFIMLMVLFAIRGYKGVSFFVMLIGTVGAVNVINSFSHLRMTLSVASLSTIYSMCFGIVVGIIFIIAFYYLFKFIDNKKIGGSDK